MGSGKPNNTVCQGNRFWRRCYNIRGIGGLYSSFSSEAAAMALTDARAAGDLERQQSEGKGFTFQALPLEGYTDLVQYLGIAQDTAEEKRPYIQDYLFNIVLSEESQEKLPILGCRRP